MWIIFNKIMKYVNKEYNFNKHVLIDIIKLK